MPEPIKQDPKPKDTDPKGGNPDPKDGNPSPGDNPENIKALQRKLSEKDLELKTAVDKLDKIEKDKTDNRSETEKMIGELQGQIKELVGQVGEMNLEKRKIEISKKFPDILPELLAGKTDEEMEKIVERQRAVSKKLYGDSEYFRQPTYTEEAEVEKEIDAVIKDPKKSGIEAAVDVLKLSRLRNRLFNK